MDRTEEARAIYQTVRQEPPAERETKLERVCRGDMELLNAVKELLLEEQRAANPDLLANSSDGQPPKVDKYEILQRIGRGGFGDVFLGRDTVIKREVAIKLCNSPDHALIQRFAREVKIIGGLRHPNITTLHDSGNYGDVPYLVQEYLPGEDLEEQIRYRRPTPPVRRLDILVQVARGLAYAHGQAVVHRDVKPSNVRVLDDGTAKIMDFGVARLLSAHTRLTATGMRVGTMCYMAPEQLRGEEVDARADIFSFGVLAFELLTHRHPFPAESSHAMIYQVLESEPPDILELWPECPENLADCVERCLEKDPGKRYRNMSEVVTDLEAVTLRDTAAALDDTDATIVRTAARRRRRRDGRRRPALIAAAVLLTAALAAAWFVVERMRSEAPPPPEPALVEPTAVEPVPVNVPPEDEPAAASPEPVAAEPPPEPSPPPVPRPEPSPPPEPQPEPPPPPPEPRPEPPPPEPEPEPVTTAPAPAPPPPVRVPLPAALPVRGQLLVNAFPWASVLRITGADGTVYQPVMNSRYTPLALTLNEGVYTVVLSHPVHGERRCQARVGAETAVSCRIPWAKVDADAFFQQSDLGTPAYRDDRRPPPRPGLGGPGRPPPRREEMQPKWMQKAAQKYFDGDYSAVYAAMASKKASDASTIFFARLFLGAAQHALYLLDGEKDDALRRSAVENLRQCREDFPSFVPHSDFFSPRFIEFYSVDAMPAG